MHSKSSGEIKFRGTTRLLLSSEFSEQNANKTDAIQEDGKHSVKSQGIFKISINEKHFSCSWKYIFASSFKVCDNKELPLF